MRKIMRAAAVAAIGIAALGVLPTQSANAAPFCRNIGNTTSFATYNGSVCTDNGTTTVRVEYTDTKSDAYCVWPRIRWSTAVGTWNQDGPYACPKGSRRTWSASANNASASVSIEKTYVP
jgi:hypothetical protein